MIENINGIDANESTYDIINVLNNYMLNLSMINDKENNNMMNPNQFNYYTNINSNNNNNLINKINNGNLNIDLALKNDL